MSTTVPGYPVGVAFAGGESVGIGLSIPGIYALPDELLGPLQGLEGRLDAFRDAATFYVAKSETASDSNNGTSPGEPLRSLGAAITKANAYVTANPGALCSIHLNPGVYTESGLPFRVRRNICIKGDGILRTTTIKPAAGEEMNGFLKVDSGFMAWGLTFAGHQANSLLNQQSWAIQFDDQADNTGIGASSLGAYIQISPYIQNCTSITAEDDTGVAPSTSVGDTGGGILVDGTACALNSPIRSMVVDSYTQVNLGGPGCLVKNDGYAQLVSFFGTFCTYHVRTESGGQVNLSGGTTDFGVYGLMADGYSPSAIYTATARQAYYGARLVTRFGEVADGNSLFTSVGHTFAANDIVTPSGADLPSELVNGQPYYVIASGLTADTFRISATEGGSAITFATGGTVQFFRSGVLEVDVVNMGTNRLGPISRPNPGQLMFPRLNFPSAGTSGSPGNAATVASVSGTEFTLNLQTTTFKHEWSGGGTITVNGSATYTITSLTYEHTSGATKIRATGYTPVVGNTVTISGASFICPTESVYVITGSIPIDASGNVVSFGAPEQAGYRIQFYSQVNRGLRYPLASGQVLDFRLRSQISAPGHTFEYVGSGTNYNALPWRGGIPIRANERVESNNGRVFSSNTNELGDFKVGDAFSVDGTTGTVTINTDQFNLSGLNFIGPFSRNGGFSTVGVQLQEVSNDAGLIASTGTADGNTVPTQFAVKTFVEGLVAATILQLQTYTDDAVSTSATTLTNYIDAEIVDAKAYTDTEVSSVAAAAEAYTNTEVAGAKSYADTEIAAAVDAVLVAEVNNDYPTIRPTLDINFASSKALDPRLTYARNSIGTYYDAKGVLRTAVANEPRIEHDPSTGECLGVLVEEQRTNSVPYSEDLASWPLPSTANSNTTTSPGGNTAYGLDSALTASMSVSNPAAITFSVFAKSGTSDFIYLRTVNWGTVCRVWFNLSAGTVGSIQPPSGNIKNVGISELSNGWYRVFFTLDSTGNSVGNFQITSTDADLNNDAVGYVFAWGAQVEEGSFPTSYIPTPATFTSRASLATYYDSAGLLRTALFDEARTAAYFPDEYGIMRPAGLLLEAAATNITPESETFTDIGSNTGAWTANSTTAPDGFVTADKWVPANGSTANSSRRAFTPTNATYTASVFVKKADLRYVMLAITQNTGSSYSVLFDLDATEFFQTNAFVKDNQANTPTDINYSVQKFPNGWFRLSVTKAVTSAGGDTYFYYGVTSNAAATFPFPSQISHTGNGTAGTFFWGAQIEVGNYPTSYIKTDATAGGLTRAADTSTSAAATRARDTLKLEGTNFSSWFNENEGTLVLDSDILGTDDNDYLLHINDGTETTNAVRLQYVANQVVGKLTRAGTDTFSAGTSQNLASTTLALAYKENDVNAAAAGTAGTPDTAALLPRTLTQLNFAEGPAAARPLSATFKRLTYYPERLGDTTLGTITL